MLTFSGILTTTSPLARAQQTLNGTITLKDEINATLEANPRLRIFPLLNEALAGERETVNLDPSFRVSSNVENVLGTESISGISATELNLSLSQVVEMGDKRTIHVNTINRRFDLLNTERKVAELDLLGEVVRRFNDVASAQERLGLQ